MKTLLLRLRLTAAILVMSAAFSAAVAQSTPDVAIPAGYYKSLNGLRNTELKTAIYRLVRNFTEVSSYNALPQYFFYTDTYPESDRWWDMYSNIPLYGPSFRGLNREHSFPKSWWGGSTEVPAYVDLNHMYPSEQAANMAKSNYPLGTVDRSASVTFDNGVTTVGYPVHGQGGGANFVFEPADEYKGDFARTYFYMATAYQDLRWKYTYMVSNNTYPTLNPWSVELLLAWNRQDPVSDKERVRNAWVYRFQNNRNPFIDYPELAEYLWGDRRTEAFYPGSSSLPTGDPLLVTPVQDMSLDFGQVAEGGTVQSRLFFNGENLTAPLRVQVYRDDAAMFSLSTSSIDQTLVNREDGYWLTVTYRPTSTGRHTSRLLISGGGIAGSRGIALIGECLPVPTLTAPTATEASDITPTSYVANWTPVGGETVDYYVVTRTRYTGGNAVTEELDAETNSLQIDDFGESEREAYSVQSVRLGYRSPMSNVVFVEHAGVTGVETDSPLAVQSVDGGLRIICSAPHTGLRVYDATGKTVVSLPQAVDNTDISLPAGVYFVTSDSQHRPLKVLVR